MRLSDVKERYVYYVNFDPVKECEFDKQHLAVVLKKNIDKKTAIVMPLTSQVNGAGINTIILPTIESLPQRLKSDKSYAAYDKVRTVNYSRFEPIYKEKTGKEVIEVRIEDETFKFLIKICTEEVEKKLTLEEKIDLYNEKLNHSINEKIVNLAYSIKKSDGDKEKIKSISSEIQSIINIDRRFVFSDKEKEDGIENIIFGILGIETNSK